ncbi:protein HASTY 1 isoform X2 [Impatiens glandulifera]|uniref:protein HASTY 1 isoform X2 n=1 Tax=Impatiens glandulifera TaxID=253017 RepID=UPI001FB108AD|nr:protein HASTY 1 isoform X2 [Impatiens glandulifera]
MDESGVANNVARAIVAVLDWSTSPDARKAAVSYLESIKGGDIRVLASISFILVKKEWSSEIRLHAYKLLQHMVRLRWEELSSGERHNFAKVAFDMMSEMSNPCEEWALKSQTAALVAEIIRREGLNLWQELFPSLISLAGKGPVQAELVSITLRWLPEDITVHNEDLEGERRRLLLRGLTQSLSDIFPLLYSLLERHFGAVISEAGQQRIDIAKQHAATVTATLNALNAYAEWAPLPELSKHGIVHGCGFLLSSPDFRLHAAEFFKLVSSRKRPYDDTTEYDSAMRIVFEKLMGVSNDFLRRSESISCIDESELEFAECICDSMANLGSLNLQCVSGDETIVSVYLQQMLSYFRHDSLAIHYQSMLFWLALLRDLLSKPKILTPTTADGSAIILNSALGHGSKEKKNLLALLNDDICTAILDTSFRRLVKKEKILPGSSFSSGSLELWNEDFEGKGEFSQYRSKLLELIRFVSSVKPVIAASRVSERVATIFKCLLLSASPVQELAVPESMQLALDSVVNAVFDGSSDYGGSSSEHQVALHRIFEGLLQQLLSLKWTEPALVELLGHYLDALGPFLKHFPDAVGSVINKLFELLNSLPYAIKDPSTNVARHARLQICTSFIRIAKAVDKGILPYMKGIADTMAYLQKEGCLLRAEHNLLGEAFLVMASSAGIQQQQEVLAWLLEPLSLQWNQLEWQNTYLSEPAGLIRLCSETPFMWSLFHTVTFFEKALKRSGIRKGSTPLQNNLSGTSPAHPMASHLSWMLPPLLRLLRAVHSLWSPSIAHGLPGEMKFAMAISDPEKTSLLGEANPKLGKSAVDRSQIDMNKEGTEPNETDIRNWLKGIRDSGYNVLGLSTTIGDAFFKCLDSQYVSIALIENVQSMEFRHLRQLVHLVIIPLVKNCPPNMWEKWLENILHPLFNHSHQALVSSWSSLLQEGRAKVPDLCSFDAGPILKVEVMEEKLLRDLTREISALLSVLASPGVNTGLPLLEQSGHVNRPDPSSLRDLESFTSNSMVGYA